jgi:uncharacterized protein YdcH (DUF465 family)
MSNTPHELAEEFPEYLAEMHHLKETDGHFARLFNDYHTLNRAVHRAETDIEPVDDATMTDMRRKRMQLKDRIYGMLVNPESAA